MDKSALVTRDTLRENYIQKLRKLVSDVRISYFVEIDQDWIELTEQDIADGILRDYDARVVWGVWYFDDLKFLKKWWSRIGLPQEPTEADIDTLGRWRDKIWGIEIVYTVETFDGDVKEFFNETGVSDVLAGGELSWYTTAESEDMRRVMELFSSAEGQFDINLDFMKQIVGDPTLLETEASVRIAEKERVLDLNEDIDWSVDELEAIIKDLDLEKAVALSDLMYGEAIDAYVAENPDDQDLELFGSVYENMDTYNAKLYEMLIELIGIKEIDQIFNGHTPAYIRHMLEEAKVMEEGTLLETEAGVRQASAPQGMLDRAKSIVKEALRDYFISVDGSLYSIPIELTDEPSELLDDWGEMIAGDFYHKWGRKLNITIPEDAFDQFGYYLCENPYPFEIIEEYYFYTHDGDNIDASGSMNDSMISYWEWDESPRTLQGEELVHLGKYYALPIEMFDAIQGEPTLLETEAMSKVADDEPNEDDDPMFNNPPEKDERLKKIDTSMYVTLADFLKDFPEYHPKKGAEVVETDRMYSDRTGWIHAKEVLIKGSNGKYILLAISEHTTPELIYGAWMAPKGLDIVSRDDESRVVFNTIVQDVIQSKLHVRDIGFREWDELTYKEQKKIAEKMLTRDNRDLPIKIEYQENKEDYGMLRLQKKLKRKAEKLVDFLALFNGDNTLQPMSNVGGPAEFMARVGHGSMAREDDIGRRPWLMQIIKSIDGVGSHNVVLWTRQDDGVNELTFGYVQSKWDEWVNCTGIPTLLETEAMKKKAEAGIWGGGDEDVNQYRYYDVKLDNDWSIVAQEMGGAYKGWFGVYFVEGGETGIIRVLSRGSGVEYNKEKIEKVVNGLVDFIRSKVSGAVSAYLRRGGDEDDALDGLVSDLRSEYDKLVVEDPPTLLETEAMKKKADPTEDDVEVEAIYKTIDKVEEKFLLITDEDCFEVPKSEVKDVFGDFGVIDDKVWFEKYWTKYTGEVIDYNTEKWSNMFVPFNGENVFNLDNDYMHDPQLEEQIFLYFEDGGEVEVYQRVDSSGYADVVELVSTPQSGDFIKYCIDYEASIGDIRERLGDKIDNSEPTLLDTEASKRNFSLSK